MKPQHARQPPKSAPPVKAAGAIRDARLSARRARADESDKVPVAVNASAPDEAAQKRRDDEDAEADEQQRRDDEEAEEHARLTAAYHDEDGEGDYGGDADAH